MPVIRHIFPKLTLIFSCSAPLKSNQIKSFHFYRRKRQRRLHFFTISETSLRTVQYCTQLNGGSQAFLNMVWLGRLVSFVAPTSTLIFFFRPLILLVFLFPLIFEAGGGLESKLRPRWYIYRGRSVGCFLGRGRHFLLLLLRKRKKWSFSCHEWEGKECRLEGNNFLKKSFQPSMIYPASQSRLWTLK